MKKSTIKNMIIEKKDGITMISDYNPEVIEKVAENADKHLCWLDCKNASPLTCPKVEDLKKKPLNKYDFIKDGIQIINERGKLTDFHVYTCNKYEKSEEKKLTTKDLTRLRKLREALRMEYFDTTSIDEAYLIQNELLLLGKLKKPEGYVPDENAINKIKKRNKR